ncbi:MAG: FecR domain-containing protein [Ruminococcus sp.]|nr:FecR domain-containing protein [Ruminococcus sp.]
MDTLSTKKGKIIIAAVIAALLIAVGVILAVVLSGKEYRSISVEAVKGSVIVANDKNNDQAYKGQRLYGGDDVTVNEASDLTMCMNNSQYLYADENTHFRLEDRSDDNSSRIRVILDKGSELNELTEKLKANDSYEVDTPNSTMSVRGTKFRVTVLTDSDGMVYTLLEVEEGVVLTRLKTVSGEYNGAEKEFRAGQSALIRADADFSEFVKSEKGDEVLILDLASLPKEPVPRLRELLRLLLGPKASAPAGDDSSSQPDDSSSMPDDSSQPDDSSSGEHTHIQGEFETAVEAGCETKGEKIAKCTVCGEVMATEEIEPLGHDFSGWSAVEGTSCYAEGSERRECSRCGKTETRSSGKADHSWSAWQAVKQPTCGTEGSEKRVCTVCGEKETRSLAASGAHKWGALIEDTAAGCLTDGSGHYVCSVCGTKGNTVSIPAKGHSFSAWTTQRKASCGVTGLDTRTCSVCGATESRIAAALEHKWSSWKTSEQATCGTSGTDERICSVCGKKNTRYVAATGLHNFSELIVDVPAECIYDGSGHYECTVCGAKSEQEVIPKTGHHYEVFSTVMIDKDTQETTYKCKNCNSVYTTKKKV